MPALVASFMNDDGDFLKPPVDESLNPPDPPPPSPDERIYIPQAEGWQAKIKQGVDRVCCYSKLPGDDFFHNIVNGEIYLESESGEKYCLRCAVRLGVGTRERLFWKRRANSRPH